MKTIEDLRALLALIALWHLVDVAKQECAYCWDMALRILDTGSDLQLPDMEEDTARSVDLLCNPRNWGIANPEWKSMCSSIEPKGLHL